jgi:hypothetical protein
MIPNVNWNSVKTDGIDFLVWQRNYRTPPVAVSQLEAIPEPASALLFVLGVLALQSRRALQLAWLQEN